MFINSKFCVAAIFSVLSSTLSIGFDFAAIISLKFGYLGSTPPAVTDITHLGGIFTFSDPSVVCLVSKTSSPISKALT